MDLFKFMVHVDDLAVRRRHHMPGTMSNDALQAVRVVLVTRSQRDLPMRMSTTRVALYSSGRRGDATSRTEPVTRTLVIVAGRRR